MDSTFIVNIGFTLLIAGIITYYVRQQNEATNHKISSMFSIVSSLTQEVNILKSRSVSGGSVPNVNVDTPKDGRIEVPDELKRIKISQDSSEEDDSSEDETDDEEEEEEEEEDNDDDSPPTEEHDTQEEQEEEEETQEEQEEETQEEQEEETQEVIELNVEEATKSISLDENSTNYANLHVGELRKIVSSKKLVPNSKTLKKQELLDILGNQ
tara:strand:- start:6772 stop:7407 length:636 start_codon:yes stop_codon:yes gene_type:complete